MAFSLNRSPLNLNALSAVFTEAYPEVAPRGLFGSSSPFLGARHPEKDKLAKAIRASFKSARYHPDDMTQLELAEAALDENSIADFLQKCYQALGSIDAMGGGTLEYAIIVTAQSAATQLGTTLEKLCPEINWAINCPRI